MARARRLAPTAVLLQRPDIEGATTIIGFGRVMWRGTAVSFLPGTFVFFVVGRVREAWGPRLRAVIVDAADCLPVPLPLPPPAPRLELVSCRP